jgi:hypothetical protein
VILGYLQLGMAREKCVARCGVFLKSAKRSALELDNEVQLVRVQILKQILQNQLNRFSEAKLSINNEDFRWAYRFCSGIARLV